MTRLTLRVWAITGLLAALALTATPNAAWAFTDCRTIDTVLHSADPAQNAGDGGHLAKHVEGLVYQDLGNPQQVGTRAYPDGATFTAVWDAYLLLAVDRSGRPNCDGSVPAPRAQIPFNRLADVDAFDVRLCNAADQGSCTAWEDGPQVGNLNFSFSQNGGGHWILNTSYPYP